MSEYIYANWENGDLLKKVKETLKSDFKYLENQISKGDTSSSLNIFSITVEKKDWSEENGGYGINLLDKIPLQNGWNFQILNSELYNFQDNKIHSDIPIDLELKVISYA